MPGRSVCRWCTHPKGVHTGRYRKQYMKWYPAVRWTNTCCDECYMQDKQCRRYEKP